MKTFLKSLAAAVAGGALTAAAQAITSGEKVTSKSVGTTAAAGAAVAAVAYLLQSPIGQAAQGEPLSASAVTATAANIDVSQLEGRTIPLSAVIPGAAK